MPTIQIPRRLSSTQKYNLQEVKKRRFNLHYRSLRVKNSNNDPFSSPSNCWLLNCPSSEGRKAEERCRIDEQSSLREPGVFGRRSGYREKGTAESEKPPAKRLRWCWDASDGCGVQKHWGLYLQT